MSANKNNNTTSNQAMSMNSNLDNIIDSFWADLESFRHKYGYDVRDFYYSSLFLIILYKEDGLTKITGKTNERISSETVDYYMQLFQLWQNLEQKKREQLSEIFSLWMVNEIKELIEVFKTSNPRLFDHNFPYVVEQLIFKIFNLEGKKAWSNVLPKQIYQLLSSIPELPKNASIYNPFAGIASWALMDPKPQKYVGQELGVYNYAISILRLFANNLNTKMDFFQGDSLKNWNPTSETFDMVVSFQPFNLKLNEPITGAISTIQYAEEYVIEKSLECLSSNGILITWMPKSFCFRDKSAYEYRKFLVDNDLLQYIIEFPGGILPNTNIPFVILILNKSKANKNIIKMVKTNDHAVRKLDGSVSLNIAALAPCISDPKPNSAVLHVSNEQIINSDYNLSVSPYFSSASNDDHRYELVSLSAILSLHKGGVNSNNNEGLRLKIRDLPNDAINYHVNLNNKEIGKTDGKSKVITKNVLLVANKGNLLKPSYLVPSDIVVSVSPDIYAFEINERLVDVSYLIHELFSDYVQEQIADIRHGSAIPFITSSDFLRIVIKLPQLGSRSTYEQSLKVQNLLMSTVQAIYFKSKENDLQYKKKILGLEESSYREFASIRHTLRQYLNSLESNVSGTLKFLENNRGKNITVDSIYSYNLNRTLGDHLLSIHNTVTSMNAVLSVGNNRRIHEVKTEKTNVLELLHRAMERTQNESKFIFETPYIDHDSFKLQIVARSGDPENGEDINMVYEVYNAPIKEADPIIEINSEDFYILFSNIVANAVVHGFRESKKENIIRTSISLDIENFRIVVEISNNGRPFPENYTFENLVTWGDKSSNSPGTGIGGAEIKDILKRYNAQFTLRLDSQSDFPVCYTLYFPFINTIEDEN